MRSEASFAVCRTERSRWEKPPDRGPGWSVTSAPGRRAEALQPLRAGLSVLSGAKELGDALVQRERWPLLLSGVMATERPKGPHNAHVGVVNGSRGPHWLPSPGVSLLT